MLGAPRVIPQTREFLSAENSLRYYPTMASRQNLKPKAAKTEYFPTKEQAVIVDAVEGMQLKYIVAFADKITP